MLSLAISFDQTLDADVIEIEDGARLTVRNWPQDSETNIVAHRPNGRAATVVNPSQLADDIALFFLI